MIKVQGFRCRMCLTGRDTKDRIKDLVLENGEVIEGVGQFCYLGNVRNGEGSSSMASINRVRSDVVLHHTLPIFMRLGWCLIVSWDFAGAMGIFGPDALPVIYE